MNISYMIRKGFFKSGFDPDATFLFSRMTTEPTIARKVLINDFMKKSKALKLNVFFFLIIKKKIERK